MFFSFVVISRRHGGFSATTLAGAARAVLMHTFEPRPPAPNVATMRTEDMQAPRRVLSCL